MAALDALRASVMTADADLNITYVNLAAIRLLQEAEADLRQELPSFSVARLVGSNIDIFHRNPDHQRKMLASLDKPHNAAIRIGKRAFDLLVSPLADGGRHIGFVVEWTDARTRLLDLDHSSQIAAIGRSQAVIEFTVDSIIIDANPKFLGAMGYTLEEIQGRKHGIFVEQSVRESREYAAFWESLRRGEYQAAQFRRIGKHGREVWIEGAYNPVLDEHGKVSKIVKVANDVTIQVELLANLKTLIDQNFGEIDDAIGLSTSGASSASTAVSETSENVRSLAASAEQLAASIREISQSMARSRLATDNAFDRSVAAGKSTATLSDAAQAMNGIAGLIRNVASQINLLALNATIEAARAGDAGKGFAVVASEVKNLAVQAAKATEQISMEISGIQTTSIEVAGALVAIREAITTVREGVMVTASAVEEQTAVTHSMSVDMRKASDGVSTVSGSINQIASAISQAARAASKTRRAAEVLVR